VRFGLKGNPNLTFFDCDLTLRFLRAQRRDLFYISYLEAQRRMAQVTFVPKKVRFE
jgi:hypothetical protein